jgi:hypothetical protein
MYKIKNLFFRKPKNRVNDPISLSAHFSSVFKTNAWKSGESFSGVGSTLEQTSTLRRELELVIAKLEIKSILDIPCGDANWMKEEEYFQISYTGVDIVPELILLNKEINSETHGVKFLVGDFTSLELRESFDMVFCRDLFVHLSYQDILKCFNSFIQTGSRYLAITTFSKVDQNENLIYPTKLDTTIGWRPLNMQIKPFSMNSPLYILDEKCTEQDGDRIYNDKSIAIFSYESVVMARENLERFLS